MAEVSEWYVFVNYFLVYHKENATTLRLQEFYENRLFNMLVGVIEYLLWLL